MLLESFAKHMKSGGVDIESFLGDLLQDHPQVTVFLFGHKPPGSKMVCVPGAVKYRPDLEESELVELALHAVEGNWRQFEYAPREGKEGIGWSSRLDLDEQYFSSMLVFVADGQEFNQEIRATLNFALVALGMAWFSQDIQDQVVDIHKYMRFQAVWGETQQWIKGVYEENDKLYLEVLTRAELVTGSTGSAIRLYDQDGQSERWLQRKIEVNAITCLADTYGTDTILAPEKPHRLNDIKASIDSPQNHSIRHLLIYPVFTEGRRLKSVIYVTKQDNEQAYGQLDEVWLSQLMTQVYYGLDKNILLRALESRHDELDKERKEQEKLINQLKDATSKLVQSEKLASIGQLAAGVAHEINNPVGYVSSNISTLSEYIDSMFGLLDEVKTSVAKDQNCGGSLTGIIGELEDRYEADYIRSDVQNLIAESMEGIHRVRQIIQSLKDFSRPDTGEYTLADLHYNIDRTLNIVHNELKHRVTVIKEYGNLPQIEMVESQIGQVILNLLVNAGHAIEKQGQIVIRTFAENDQVCMAFEDNGKGIEPQNLEKLFDPFFTTKPVGQGTGLGLALSYGIINKHHGYIEVDSKPGVGTTFRVYLPIVQPEGEDEV